MPSSEKSDRSVTVRPWIIGVFIGVILLIVVLAITAPLSKSLQPLTAPSITLLSAEGRPIARRGAVVEGPVKVADLPAHVPDAFLAIEDVRFYNHAGVDPWGIMRAALANLTSASVAQGGSTISQQLAKLSFLSPDQTITRKAQEFVLAFWLEAWLKKDEILSRYLSSVYFGDNVYGLRAAANHYFSRKPEELTLKEAAMLAGLVKAPSRLAPTSNIEGARQRGEVVLKAMVDAGYVDAKTAAEAPEVQLRPGPVKDVPKGTYFADWVLVGMDDSEARYGEHQIMTTLEDRLQRLAVKAIRSTGTGGAQVALVSMRPDGRVVAMVGGRSYQQSPFNRATQAKRQPGSTFKLFVYLAALRAGHTPSSYVEDEPFRLGDWSPQNYEGKYRGPITLREAFAVSSNVAAVRLSERVGRDQVIKAARDLGVTSDLNDTPSLALGTAGVSLLEMVAAFAAVKNGSYPVVATGIPEEATGATMAFNESNRKMLMELLWSAANEGTGRAAALPAGTFGKTGTTQDNRDAYFIGFAGDLVTGVWIGRDNNDSLGDAVGGGIPAQIWRAYMAEAVRDAPPAEVPEPAAETSELPDVAPEVSTHGSYYVPDYDVEAVSVPSDLPTSETPFLEYEPIVDPGSSGVAVEPLESAPPVEQNRKRRAPLPAPQEEDPRRQKENERTAVAPATQPIEEEEEDEPEE